MSVRTHTRARTRTHAHTHNTHTHTHTHTNTHTHTHPYKHNTSYRLPKRSVNYLQESQLENPLFWGQSCVHTDRWLANIGPNPFWNKTVHGPNPFWNKTHFCFAFLTTFQWELISFFLVWQIELLNIYRLSPKHQLSWKMDLTPFGKELFKYTFSAFLLQVYCIMPLWESILFYDFHCLRSSFRSIWSLNKLYTNWAKRSKKLIIDRPILKLKNSLCHFVLHPFVFIIWNSMAYWILNVLNVWFIITPYTRRLWYSWVLARGYMVL